MTQTATSSCTRKYAQRSQQKAQQKAQQKSHNKKTITSNKTYKRVIVKLVRLLSARPAAVSLVAIGSVLPNPL